MRSLLLANAADPEALGRAAASEADAVAIDLPEAHGAVAAEAARALRPRPLFLRIGPLRGESIPAGLAAVAACRPDGALLPADDGLDVQHLGALLAVEEAKAGLAAGAIGVVAVLASGRSLLALASFAHAGPRLRALMWDGEAIARDIGAEAARSAAGDWIEPCRTARSLTLAAAAAAAVPAIDAPCPIGALALLRREAEEARRDGFAGKAIVDAAQAAAVNAAFGGPRRA